MIGITTDMNFKERQHFVDTYLTPKYNINTIKDNGLDIDVKESLITRMKASRGRRKEQSNFIDINHYATIPTIRAMKNDRVAIHDIASAKLSSLFKDRDEAEVELDNKIDDFHDYVLKSKYSEIFDFPEDGLNVVEDIINSRVVCTESLKASLENFSSIEDFTYIGDFEPYRYTYPSSFFESSLHDYHDGFDEWSDWYAGFIERLEDILNAKRVLRVLSSRINFLLISIKKLLRNLRQIFTRQHSFHFKNLDDYHDTSFNFSF